MNVSLKFWRRTPLKRIRFFLRNWSYVFMSIALDELVINGFIVSLKYPDVFILSRFITSIVWPVILLESLDKL